MVTPKISFTKGTAFNEVVVIEVKEYGDKYVVWCIDSFTRFMQGRLIENKRMETIMKSVNESWKIPFRIPSVGILQRMKRS